MCFLSSGLTGWSQVFFFYLVDARLSQRIDLLKCTRLAAGGR